MYHVLYFLEYFSGVLLIFQTALTREYNSRVGIIIQFAHASAIYSMNAEVEITSVHWLISVHIAQITVHSFS